MKRILFLSLMLGSFMAQAHYVRFMVDMRRLVADSMGVHIAGTFQTAAGYSGGDWMPNTTPMVRDAVDTNIWSVLVNIPAFQEYEYKFVNGDLGYKVEVVPPESQVGYLFIDNRWFYLDSLADDTTVIGPILYGENAPYGKQLFRSKVNMSHETVSAQGVHVLGSFNGFAPQASRMYSFDGAVYEQMSYVDSIPATDVFFQFANGNTLSDTETVPTACVGSDGHRLMSISTHTVMNPLCFSSCDDCASGFESHSQAEWKLVVEGSELQLIGYKAGSSLALYSTDGKQMPLIWLEEGRRLDVSRFPSGVYCLQTENSLQRFYLGK